MRFSTLATALAAVAVLAGCSEQQIGTEQRTRYDTKTVVQFAKDCREKGGSIHLDKFDSVNCKMDNGTVVSIEQGIR